MIYIKQVNSDFSEVLLPESIASGEVIASSETPAQLLVNLITALNEDAVDTDNCRLVIVDEWDNLIESF